MKLLNMHDCFFISILLGGLSLKEDDGMESWVLGEFERGRGHQFWMEL